MQSSKDASVIRKSEIIQYLVIILAALSAVLWLTRGGRLIYGTYGDWDVQHTAVPELLRRQFYATGKLIPDFIPSVGGGQNAWYYSYYGLLSPVVLLSYLFPFLSMRTYLAGAAVCAQIISACLMYQWLRRSCRRMPALTATLLFLFAAGYFHHAHYHIMFIFYMPFLIMALRSLQGQIEHGKSAAGFAAWMSLAVLCCYYFAVAEFIAAGVFAVFLGFRQADRNGNMWKEVWSAVRKMIPGAVAAVMVTAVLWMPTLYTLTGRDASQTQVSLRSLLTPVFHGEYMMYDVDSLGATALLTAVLAGMLLKKGRCWKWLGGIFLILAFFALPVYVLNGGMYVHGKVLIPFLPLMALMEARFLDDMVSGEVPWKKLFLILAPLGALCFLTFGSESRMWFLADFCLTVLVLMFFVRKRTGRKMNEAVMVLLLIPALITTAAVNHRKALLPEGWHASFPAFQQISREYRTGYLMGKWAPANLPITENENLSTIYSSVSNPNYSRYYHALCGNEVRYRNSAWMSQTMNPYFCAQMGIRYIITDRQHRPPQNYRLAAEKGNYRLYENRSVLPMFYTAKAECDLNKEKQKTVSVPGMKSSYTIHSRWAQKKVFHLKDSDRDRIIRITAVMKNHRTRSGVWFGIWSRNGMIQDRGGDVQVSVNQIPNVRTSPNAIYDNWNRTFKYTMYVPAHQTELRWTFHHGDYELDHIRVTQSSAADMVNAVRSVQKVNLDQKHSKGNRITAEGTLQKGERLYTSIPYDRGFSAVVDGKPATVEKTKLGFLSVSGNWRSGKHRIVIVYHAPGKRAGMAISLAGLILIAVMASKGRKKHENINIWYTRIRKSV